MHVLASGSLLTAPRKEHSYTLAVNREKVGDVKVRSRPFGRGQGGVDVSGARTRGNSVRLKHGVE